MSEQLYNIQFLHHAWQVPEVATAEVKKSFRERIKEQNRIASIAREFGGHVIEVL